MAIKILLIEDDDGDSRLIKEMLNAAFPRKYIIKVETSLKKSLRLIADEAFDIVLTDLNLPDSNGVETFTCLRKKIASAPIVVLSGIREIALRVVNLGADAYLIKGHGNGGLISRTIDYAIESKQHKQHFQSHTLKEILV
ncbi:Response regulator receiver domain-containing protein [Nitrosomonas sp. Nm51]|uniref:response regulator n=1 Tax=Nitrosomonas sp. Nm51 TaxID=133720 RepID=UPI0008CDC56F|nr:response regulator [Nitrosomonas sp. Nm51]SER44199.1 Response regulator receiver domain-containing protein [Nitrosomonas sp. Nm51]